MTRHAPTFGTPDGTAVPRDLPIVLLVMAAWPDVTAGGARAPHRPRGA